MCEFVTAKVLPGKTNALVKGLMEWMGLDDPNEAVRRVNSGEWRTNVTRFALQRLTVWKTVTWDGVEIDLVKTSPEDLGFAEQGTSVVVHKEFCAWGRFLGLVLCPVQFGGVLRSEYPDQPPGEHLRLAMEPFGHKENKAHVVDEGVIWVIHNNPPEHKLKLETAEGNGLVFGDHDYVFIKPR